ncbi:MAG: FixH family protein [Paludibacteraceae bacterium]|nr:FixH family protein [Paludibacteraceae bacterium]
MKINTNKYKCTLGILIIGLIFSLISCKKNDDNTVDNTSSTTDATTGVAPAQEVASLILKEIAEFTKGNYTFYLYRKTSAGIITGYNEIYVQVKNNVSGNYVQDASLSWYPLLHKISAPASAISKVSGTNTIYKGYIIFLTSCTDTATEYWQLTVNYTSGTDTLARASSKLYVTEPTYKRLNVLQSAVDGQQYIIALVEPTTAVVGSDVITAYVYNTVSSYSFALVPNYKILIDPRMPDMANMGSSGNVNLSYDSATGLYKGTVNFSMTGYWEVGLILENASNQVLLGNEINDNDTTASTIYFEFGL